MVEKKINSIMKKLLLLILFTGNWFFMKGQGGPDPASMLKSIETANDSLKPRMYSRIGFYYYSRDQVDSAFYYVNLSLSVSRKLNLKNEIGNAYNNLGSLCRLRSDFSTAFDFFKKALDA